MQDNSEVRDFCLKQIKEEYGYEYNKDWHFDLDSMLDAKGVYTASQQGALVSRFHTDNIVGCGGLRSLKSHPSSYNSFHKRYVGKKVGALWRVYVKKSYQRMGLGSSMVNELEVVAEGFGYDCIYLHTSLNNPKAVRFWEKMGYEAFQADDNQDKTLHMEKYLQ